MLSNLSDKIYFDNFFLSTYWLQSKMLRIMNYTEKRKKSSLPSEFLVWWTNATCKHLIMEQIE